MEAKANWLMSSLLELLIRLPRKAHQENSQVREKKLGSD